MRCQVGRKVAEDSGLPALTYLGLGACWQKIVPSRQLDWVGHQSGPGIIVGMPTRAEEPMIKESTGAKESVLRRQATARQCSEVIGLREAVLAKAVDLQNRLDKVRISTPQKQP